MTAFGPGVASRAQATRSLEVAERLRQEVLQGVIKPGARLRQSEVAARFGVSTTPVREAFATLSQEGLMRRDANRGVVVFEPSVHELRETYEIRLELEPLATRLATPRLADVDIDMLDAIITEMHETTDPIRRDRLNRELHAQIYAKADRPRLSGIIDQLRDASAVYLRFLSQAASSGSGYRAEADTEHRKITAALRRRDAVAAGEAVREHLAHSQKHIEAVIGAGAVGLR